MKGVSTMHFLQRLMNRFATDVEVDLVVTPASPYFAKEESTVDGGALTTMLDGDRMRLVFHGGVIGGGSYVVLRCADGREMKITRGWFGRLDVVLSGASMREPLTWGFDLAVGGTPEIFVDPYGKDARLTRYRHKDFQLFRPSPKRAA